PPISRYSTPWSLRDSRNSRKSAVSDSGSIIEFAEQFKLTHPFDRFQRMPPGPIGAFHFFETVKAGYHGLDHPGLGRTPSVLPFHNGSVLRLSCHLLAGGFRFFRTVRRSRCQALASSAGSSADARTCARSRPRQTFSLSGTSRATGVPFL